ncbi:MAG TPA: cytochrome c [Burkholderiales bacterium]|nr:cytochrome c [Burkholderiales bacterium]
MRYPQAVMKANGGHMAAAGAIVNDKSQHRDQLADHARALEGLNKNIAALFPKGPGKETDVKQEVWSKWGGFEKHAKDARDKSAAFAKAVVGNDVQAAAARYGVGRYLRGLSSGFPQRLNGLRTQFVFSHTVHGSVAARRPAC